MNKFLTLVGLALLPALAWADPIGKITFFEGTVKIVRDEKTITGDKIDFGAAIENYDMISTGPNSTIEVQLDSKTGVSGKLKLSANSAFYIELSALKKEQAGSVELLKGAIALKVDKMVGKTSFKVKTDSAVMGVRGTTFKVTGTNNGEFLVTCEEGKVECTNDEGATVFAEPGAVTQVIPEEGIKNIPVSVSTLETFERNWFAERSKAFEANAPRAIANYAKRYDDLSAKLRRAYEKLEQEGMSTIATWKDQARKGVTSEKMVAMKEKKALLGNLLQVRKILFVYERIYWRLNELRGYAAKLDPNLSVGKGVTLKSFFARMDRDEKTFTYWTNQFRYLLKLYSERNEGSFPTDSFGSDDFSTDGFFD